MKEKQYDYLIVGSGLYGATFAQQAVAAGKRVLVIEKRDHVGGNVYTENIDGICVHKYGPHIFHTNDEEVYRYLSEFCTFKDFVNSPKAYYKGKYYSLPINMNTMTQLWGNITVKEAKEKVHLQGGEISRRNSQAASLEERAVSVFGKDIYETLIKGYSMKQWGRDCSDLPASIIKRLPMRYSFNNNYYNAKYQGIPVGGYTEMIEKMLKGATVRLREDYFSNREYYDSIASKTVFSGSIDSYFEYALGHLQYRTIRFDTMSLDMDYYQECAVVNYTDIDVPWNRITEHKWFGNENAPKTVITKEFCDECGEGDEPYYPILDEKNRELLKKYNNLARKCGNTFFGGRLGKYMYLDMDATVRMALDDARKALCD